MAVAGGAAKLVGDGGAMLLTQRQDLAGRLGRLACDFDNTTEKETQPGFPGAVHADGLEVVVVLRPVPLEVVRQVEHGLAKNTRPR